MKLNYFLKSFVIICLLSTTSSPAPAAIHPKTSLEDRANFLQNRLNEIEALDKSALTPSERKTLRKEVRQIKKELAAVSGGIYLSVGAILLIALLLILLL